MLPDYEEAIAQSMKQPPPPYSQVALTTNQVVSTATANVNMNSNANESQLVQSQTTTQATIPSAYDNAHNKIPPAYDETNNHPSISSTSEAYTASNEMSHTNGENLSVNGSNTNPSGRLQNQQ